MPNPSVPAAAEGVPAIKNPPLDRLSFVSRRHVGGGFDYWSGVPAGRDYSEDCETGERLAEEFIDFISKFHSEGSATLLGSIMLGMEESKAPRGQKIGFMNTINRYAMVGGFAYNVGASKVSSSRSKEIASSLLELRDRLGKIGSLVTLVAYALEGMSGDDDGSVDALQAGISEISEMVTSASSFADIVRYDVG